MEYKKTNEKRGCAKQLKSALIIGILLLAVLADCGDAIQGDVDECRSKGADYQVLATYVEEALAGVIDDRYAGAEGRITIE